jgi:hypothetical protein
MSDAIADAARLLIAEASPETLRAVLRMLLDDVAPASASRSSPSAARSSAADSVWDAAVQPFRGERAGNGVARPHTGGAASSASGP